VACIKERMGENVVESKADSFGNKILIAAYMSSACHLRKLKGHF
jgi:hypothetical protein